MRNFVGSLDVCTAVFILACSWKYMFVNLSHAFLKNVNFHGDGVLQEEREHVLLVNDGPTQGSHYLVVNTERRPRCGSWKQVNRALVKLSRLIPRVMDSKQQKY